MIKEKSKGLLIVVSGPSGAGKDTIISRVVEQMKDTKISISMTSRDPRGKEVDGVDYFIARKILRKFEQLNVSYIRDEIDGFVKYLNDTFGEGKMKECIEYLLRLKKLAYNKKVISWRN